MTSRSATILGSAALGFAVAALVLPTWTDNVESAQVVAGLVRLPADNPMRLYHLSVISALIDSAALLLRLGLSEWTLSVLSSGLQGAVAFAAITACALALSARPSIALLIPLLLTKIQLAIMDVASGPFGYWPKNYLLAFHGHAYPIVFPNHASIYGVIGLFGTMLIWALFALRYDRTAAFFCGLFPWFHLTMSLACWIGVAGGMIAWRRAELSDRSTRSTLIRWFLIGLLPAALGIAGHAAFLAPSVATDRSIALDLVSTYIRTWDDHQSVLSRSVSLLSVDCYVMLLMVLIVLRARRMLTPALRFLVRSHVTVTACSLLSILIMSRYDHPALFLQQLMTIRWLNVNSMIFPVLVFSILGYLGVERKNPLAVAMLFLNALVIALTGLNAQVISSHLAFLGEGS